MVRRFIIVLCVFAVAALAQNTAVPLAETDSVAYYEEMYAYNYQKFRADESVADAFFWTSVTLSALAPVSAMLLGARSMGCNVNGDNDCSASALDIGIAVPLLLFLPSWITYGSFTLAKNIRMYSSFKDSNSLSWDALYFNHAFFIFFSSFFFVFAALGAALVVFVAISFVLLLIFIILRIAPLYATDAILQTSSEHFCSIQKPVRSGQVL